MYYIFEINFNRAQQQIKMNSASIRNIFFLMKSTEILTTIMYSSTYKLKENILAKSFLNKNCCTQTRPTVQQKRQWSLFPTSPEKQTNRQQNCNFLCQIFRLLNVHVVHKVHHIGDVFYNLTFNKLHAARSSLSTQVMTTQILFHRYKMNVLK